MCFIPIIPSNRMLLILHDELLKLLILKCLVIFVHRPGVLKCSLVAKVLFVIAIHSGHHIALLVFLFLWRHNNLLDLVYLGKERL